MSDLVTLTTVPNLVLAHPLVDFLTDQGISAHVPTDNLGNVDPSLSNDYGTRVMVRADDLERAQALLADFFAPPNDPPPELRDEEPADGDADVANVALGDIDPTDVDPTDVDPADPDAPDPDAA